MCVKPALTDWLCCLFFLCNCTPEYVTLTNYSIGGVLVILVFDPHVKLMIPRNKTLLLERCLLRSQNTQARSRASSIVHIYTGPEICQNATSKYEALDEASTVRRSSSLAFSARATPHISACTWRSSDGRGSSKASWRYAVYTIELYRYIP